MLNSLYLNSYVEAWLWKVGCCLNIRKWCADGKYNKSRTS